MIWINLILKKHAKQLQINKNKGVFLNLYKSLNKVFKGIQDIVEDNIYTIKYLTEFDDDKKEKDVENELKIEENEKIEEDE